MSYYQCSKCGNVDHIFGHHGAKDTAEQMDIEYLGEIPLHVSIRSTSDLGKPITVSDAASPYAAPFFTIAKRVMEKLQQQDIPPPKIIME